jgi:hypothetical protein
MDGAGYSSYHLTSPKKGCPQWSQPWEESAKDYKEIKSAAELGVAGV